MENLIRYIQGTGRRDRKRATGGQQKHIQDTHTGLGTRQTEHVLPGVSLWPRGFRKSQIDPKTGRGRPATQTDSQTEGFTYGAHMFVYTSVCVCLHRHVRESSDAFLLDFGTVYLPDAEQAPFCCPWTWD